MRSRLRRGLISTVRINCDDRGGTEGPRLVPSRVVERMQRQQLTNLPVTTTDGRLAGLLLREDAERARAAVNKS
jgi:hypothetical protein